MASRRTFSCAEIIELNTTNVHQPPAVCKASAELSRRQKEPGSGNSPRGGETDTLTPAPQRVQTRGFRYRRGRHWSCNLPDCLYF